MKIAELPVTNLMDCAVMLRKLADEIEKGGNVNHIIVVMEGQDGTLDIRGYGAVRSVSGEVGLLNMAAMELAIETRCSPNA